MARGWESKSVELQQDTAQSETSRSRKLSDAEIKLESLAITRRRIVSEIDASSNPRFRELKARALAHLDAEIANITKRAD